jgi:hypothetical protein
MKNWAVRSPSAPGYASPRSRARSTAPTTTARRAGQRRPAAVAAGGGPLARIGGQAGPLLAKDVRLTVAVAEVTGLDVSGDPLAAAADAALALMNVPR